MHCSSDANFRFCCNKCTGCFDVACCALVVQLELACAQLPHCKLNYRMPASLNHALANCTSCIECGALYAAIHHNASNFRLDAARQHVQRCAKAYTAVHSDHLRTNERLCSLLSELWCADVVVSCIVVVTAHSLFV
eukprot:17804-Heterococcus_DN1.PRE.2